MSYEDTITVLKTEFDTNITCRADLIQYILDCGRIYLGTPAIKIDRSLYNLLDAFNISLPNGSNAQLMRILKKDGVLDNVSHYTDSEYSSVNTLFHDLSSFYTFVDNFADWIEKNSTPRPTVTDLSTI